MELKDKVCWITGASSGIGEGIAKELAKEGAKIVLSARKVEELNRVKSELNLPDNQTLVLPLDMLDASKFPEKIIEYKNGKTSLQGLFVGEVMKLAQGKADAFFTCGSNRLMQLMKRLGKAHGIPGQIAMEQIMACGLGPCYVCVRTFEVDGKKELRRVCIEGPVFDLQEAVGW